MDQEVDMNSLSDKAKKLHEYFNAIHVVDPTRRMNLIPSDQIDNLKIPRKFKRRKLGKL